MALRAQLHKKAFHFRFEARTSRGIMKERICWFIRMFDTDTPDVFGIGECAPLPGLSKELNEGFESALNNVVEKINRDSTQQIPTTPDQIETYLQAQQKSAPLPSSIFFALEMATLDLAGGGARELFRNSFIEGAPIPINGLIWMGGLDFMLQQIEIKIRDGFKCIKLKVGGLDFEKECDILQYVRRKYFREEITIRLDANGAFKPDEALYKLKELSRFNIHSIEQPLRPGSEFLAELCQKSPIPVALDEELIDVSGEDRARLLDRTKPRFIILKPTLHGGFRSSLEWIELANRYGIGWWITSALESNLGLNALAQFAAGFSPQLPQGLGTGTLYEDNFQSPLEILNNGSLGFNKRETWDLMPIS